MRFGITGSFIDCWLQIEYLEDGKKKHKRFQINYLGSKSRMKLKKSFARILEENQIIH
ncbi:MAG: hypothetical protein ACI8P7_001217 [Candidatus Azotimanducaceae bacterium]|jgi:hypothetical protein